MINTPTSELNLEKILTPGVWIGHPLPPQGVFFSLHLKHALF